MAKPFSNDLRWKMVEAVQAGLSRRQTAERFNVSISCVIKLLLRFGATGDVAPAQFGGFKSSPLSVREAEIRAWIADCSDMTLAELQTKLADTGTQSSLTALARYLRRLGLTRKKRPRSPRNETARMSPRPGANGKRGNPV